MTEPENTVAEADIRLNDLTIRLVGIPFFGIAIPHLTGLYESLSWRDGMYWLGYVYFVTLAAFIWHGNRYLLFRTRKRFTWFDRPIEKLILLFMNNIFFTSPLTVAWLCVWYRWMNNPVKWDTIVVVTLVNVICVLFVTHVYETVFMVKEQQGEQLRNAQLSQAKAQAELEALKNQIDPHFMFNSLNSLVYLIDKHPPTAKLFTENLADVYRYILVQKDRTLVMLEDELAFIDKYAALLGLRFGKALHLQKNFNGTSGKAYLIPPISAFVALENAVKHNELSERAPLQVTFSIHNGTLTVQNRLQPKRNLQPSSHIGLRNLDERFQIITGKRVTVVRDASTFSVSLPLQQLHAAQALVQPNPAP